MPQLKFLLTLHGVKVPNLDKFEENNEVLVNSKLPPSFRNLRDKTCWFEKRINKRKDKTLQKKKMLAWSRSFFMVWACLQGWTLAWWKGSYMNDQKGSEGRPWVVQQLRPGGVRGGGGGSPLWLFCWHGQRWSPRTSEFEKILWPFQFSIFPLSVD